MTTTMDLMCIGVEIVFFLVKVVERAVVPF